MISRLSAVTAWLAAGHALLFGLYWLLLAVPESTVAMLFASALVAAAMAAVFGLVEAGALIAWQAAAAPRDTLRRALGALPGVWLGAVVFVIAWYLSGHAASWWQDHRGETDAWLMARFGWAETEKLHAGARWFFAFLAYVLGLSMAVSLASATAHAGLRQAGRAGWLRDAASPRRLLAVTGILLLFLWLPWQGVTWRPSWLAPDWQETAFVVAKLGVLFLVANLGWALLLGSGSTAYLTSSHRSPFARWAA